MRLACVVVLTVVFAADVAGQDAGAPPPTMARDSGADEALAAAVGHELARDPRVNAMQTKIAVEHGIVVLTGTANDAEGKQAAEDAARRIPGVRDVENRLVVADRGEPAPGASMIPEVPSPPVR